MFPKGIVISSQCICIKLSPITRGIEGEEEREGGKRGGGGGGGGGGRERERERGGGEGERCKTID